MKLITISIILIIFLVSCQSTDNSNGKERQLPSNMTYTFDCLDDAAAGNPIVKILDEGDKMIRKQTIEKIEVTDEEQSKMGEEMLANTRKTGEFKIDDNDPINDKLKFICSDLLRKRINPSKINYGIYLIDDKKTINAFTFGGKIFVTKGIILNCENDFQLYEIIGHEIGHNEKGHIKKIIQELKSSHDVLGGFGDLAVAFKKMVTAVFNQKNELEADYYGLDLVYMLGQSTCPIVSFWDKMSKDEKYDEVSDFMRSHPYSELRSKCLRNHINKNFNENCN